MTSLSHKNLVVSQYIATITNPLVQEQGSKSNKGYIISTQHILPSSSPIVSDVLKSGRKHKKENSLDMTPIFGDVYGANCDAPEQLSDTSVLVHVFLRGGLGVVAEDPNSLYE